jgi:hypothetical protein
MLNRIYAALVLTFASAAFAQTYIVPDGECRAVRFRATESTGFPDAGEAVAANRLESAYAHLPEAKVALVPVADAGSLEFTADVPDEGLVIAAITFKPTVSGVETRTDHAKAFVRCGGVARGEWRRTTGLPLEIIPQWNEGISLKPGHAMRFIALDAATKEVVRDPAMALYRAGAGLLGPGVTDQHGGVSFPESGPGRYLVTATCRRSDPEKPGHFLVDTSTLAFQIK